MMNETSSTASSPKTTVAVLGTLTEFNREPLPYDLSALVALVREIRPDLLCLDMTLDQWRQRDFSDLPLEYVEALLPLAAQSDIVVVPVGGDNPMPRAVAAGWRGMFIGWLRAMLVTLQRTFPHPTALNHGWRHDLANRIYELSRRLADQSGEHAYHAHMAQLTGAVGRVIDENPGNRILVVTNLQYCHHLRPQLQLRRDTVVRRVREL